MPIALWAVDIEASARKHGVADDDMLHAVRNHWRAFETDDPAVTMYIGPATSALTGNVWGARPPLGGGGLF